MKYYQFEFTASAGFTRHQLAVVAVANGEPQGGRREGLGVMRHQLAVVSPKSGLITEEGEGLEITPLKTPLREGAH